MARDGKERPANVAANEAQVIASLLRGEMPTPGQCLQILALIDGIEMAARKIYEANAPMNASTGTREKKPTPANTGRKRAKK